MKAIILISSIFYLLGLFIGNKIDLVKKSIPPVEKIILHKIKEYKPSKYFYFNEKAVVKTETDSTKVSPSHTDILLKNNKL